MCLSQCEKIARKLLTETRTTTFSQKSGTFSLKSGERRLFDQGCDLHHLTFRLRIRRLGVRVPSGAPAIRAVTSRNAGRGLDSFPACAAIFHIVGPWCSSGAPLFRNGPCQPVLTSTV